jgi:beta-mannosidase
VRVPDVELWWPHTHGAQPVYPVTVTLGIGSASISVDLGQVGFRTIVLDQEQGDFTLRVNDVPIFCRGACWSTVDVVRLTGSTAEYREALTLARDAGMNMIRIGGTMIYEADAFYDLCDELGILVWQDFMFSSMDYPVADETFSATVHEEVTQLLHRLQGRPCVAVLCGNNEVAQQAAMLGVPRELWTNSFFQKTLPDRCAELCPDIPYWPSSPSGGLFPFHVNAGDAHYFGYGPYLRPFDDVRTSGVRFASETLAFANVPETSTMALIPGGAKGAGHHPGWKAGVPRDNGSAWDFEDVRDHYVEQLFAVRPTQLRYADPERYLALGRVASGEVMARTIGAWRRRGSGCHGALIWFYRDLRPGAGWGILDATGAPKAAYYYTRRACQPITVILSDDGLNGVHVDAVNDTAVPVDAQLRVTLYRHGAQRVATGTTDLVIPPRDVVDVAAESVLEGGTFLDSSYAYRFGPPNHDLIVAVLTERTTGAVLGDAYHFPLGFAAVMLSVPALEATAVQLDDGTYRVEIGSESLALAVAVEAEGFRPDDNYFHLEPGMRRTVILRLCRTGQRDVGALSGTVTPLNTRHSTRIVVQ